MKAFGSASGGLDSAAVGAIAAGSTLGLQQGLLAAAGQVGLNVLAVGYTNTGKVQGSSLGNGNVVIVYENGSDYVNNIPFYTKTAGQALGYTGPEFMSASETIVFSGLSSGAIITSTEGFYGASEVKFNASLVASVPLLSLGLSFGSSFVFSFRHSDRTGNDFGFLVFVGGALESDVTVTFGNGSPIADQPTQTITPFGFGYVLLDGNTEYSINATNDVMCFAISGLNTGVLENVTTSQSAGPADVRLVMPLSNDVITHPRSGYMDGPFNNTVVNWYSNSGTEGTFTVSPGSPIDLDVSTGINTTDYNPSGFTRFKANGLIVGNSGADGAGRSATPACPVSAMGQIIAQPFYITDTGIGSRTSITLFGPYAGTAKIMEWDAIAGQEVQRYTIPVIRQSGAITTQADQLHPASGQLSNEPDAGVVTLVGDLGPGRIVSDVPIAAIVQSDSTPSGVLIRSQGGTTDTMIDQQDDETLMLGITPKSIAAEITERVDGVLVKRVIDASNVETWAVA